MPLFRKDPREKFVKSAEEGIRRLGYDGPLTFDEDLFAFRMEGDGIVLLGNLYGRYQSLPGSEADEYLAAGLAGLIQEADIPKTFEEARRRLYPGVRDRSTIEAARLMAELGGNPAIPIPHRPLGSTIVALLVLDSPMSMMTVNESHLTDWGVSFDAAMTAALDNLLPMSTDAPWGGVVEGAYASMWNDDYDASRLLLDLVVDEVIADLGITGAPVAFVPHRNLLILTGSEDVPGLQAAMGLTEDNLDQPSQVSGRPIVRGDGGWSDFEVPADHPVAAGLKRLHQADLALAYGATTTLIQQAEGEGIFVANALLSERDGVMTSTASWSDGVPAVIPKTDRIGFFRSNEDIWMVEWDAAIQVVGDLLDPTDYYPTRFRVDSFPTHEQLAVMPHIEDWQD